MKKHFLVTLFALTAALGAVAVAGSDTPMVGGAAMYPTKNIVQNASAADNLTTLVAAQDDKPPLSLWTRIARSTFASLCASQRFGMRGYSPFSKASCS